MSILYANGCSMTYGDELGDGLPDLAAIEYRLKHCYPNVVKEALGIDTLVNRAKCGGSNDRILRTTIADILELRAKYPDERIFALIGWSGFERREFYYDRNEEYLSLIPAVPLTFDNTIKRFHRIWARDFTHDIESTDRFLTQAISLQSFFESNGINFAMNFCVGSPDQYPAHHFDKARMGHLKNLYTPKEGCFIAHAKHHQFPLAPNGHPLEAAHRAWAECLIAFIRDGALY